MRYKTYPKFVERYASLEAVKPPLLVIRLEKVRYGYHVPVIPTLDRCGSDRSCGLR